MTLKCFRNLSKYYNMRVDRQVSNTSNLDLECNGQVNVSELKDLLNG